MEEEEDRQMAANSELRYITLELMKIAQKSGKSFDEVAEEFISNADKLQKMIYGEENAHKSGLKAVRTKK
ncbi:MAG: hypothetical protein N3G80_01070 [Candidatus Micrarchaeota archaeon]|nr:hypothetical protein [Candidatus Micrarchaeota archaeon]